jgi:molybdate transport system ATP-binding protein
MIDIHLLKKLTSVRGDLDLNVSITIQKGELVAFYGPSGAGKTSVLRMIAGLLKPDDGTIRVDDQEWFDASKRRSLKPQQRSIGIVFQDYALFPNMTVRENISYAAAGPGVDVSEMLELMEIRNLENKMPDMLSGGQRQRVALARAIVRKPKLLLLDEPFNALDTDLRIRMQDFILNLHQKLQLTTILVSHDLLEVARLADRVFLIDNGTITKSGRPRDVLSFQQIEGLIQALNLKYKT